MTGALAGPTRLLAAVIAVVSMAVGSMVMVSMAPAGAHTAMLRASPDRNATAGGSITVIDLEFLDPITDAAVTVTYNGVPVAGRTTVADGEVITFTLDQPLAEPGRYQVSYEMISFDTDFTTGGFFFTFDPGADPVDRIEPGGSGGLPVTTLVVSGAVLLILAGLLILFVQHVDNRRARLLDEVVDDPW